MHNTRRAFRFFKATGYVAALLTFTIESAMANSLLLLSPAQLAGSWTFYPQDDVTQACQVQLVADKTFSPEIKCLEVWLGQAPVSWSATPDGIFLMGKDGTDLVHMDRIEPGLYEAQLAGSKVLMMKRLPE
ncbi:AprI/Inh family metalloprotease inhibitor [Pseudomonas paraversuta]|uniref:AprI/Inh family metalloprotease inhibitor n=1 Tax=Pseudomonas paraversuta TaxID=2750624 RepID=UPI00028A2D44|nr:AprI/Inh family metalloprotease inhibitor [Pseudomonas paraversuta]AMB81800.1 protease inhibitor Inh [Pseudomonas fragi]NBF16398.1 AprI/Inh family metalloprotease inhibitor [Pseudomonas sp. Fl4BN2]NNG61632.1 AprI/Inh family metalloprotease inhibitor [Pseudomonas sp. GC01]